MGEQGFVWNENRSAEEGPFRSPLTVHFYLPLRK